MEASEILQYAAGAAYLYTGVFLLLGTLGLPIPEEIITLLVGYLAGSGVVNIWLIAPYTFVIIVVLDNGIYWSARKLGRGFIKKWGRFILFSEKRLKKLEGYIERHGNKTVFFSRILLGFRSTGLIMAGISRMPWKAFLLWDTLSILFFSSIMIALGYYFHYHLNKLLKDYTLVKHVIFFSIIGVIFFWLIKQLIAYHKADESSN
jgi:membrane protein DedA with SNARE-associated domain